MVFSWPPALRGLERWIPLKSGLFLSQFNAVIGLLFGVKGCDKLPRLGPRSRHGAFVTGLGMLVTSILCGLPSSVAAKEATVQQLRTEVVDSFPHDPGAFTQGLLWLEGELYESTGLYGRSSIRRTEPQSGRIQIKRDIDRAYFGEGLAVVGDRLVMLTWKSGVALVFDRETLEPTDQWGYNGEGWGLTYDGTRLIMSDGTSRLTMRSPEDFRWLATVEVTLNGKPVQRMNELEFVDGRIYANLWGDETIVRIDPETGRVDAVIEASGLLTPGESRMVDVLNGIAFDAKSETFWVTGKFWPRMFQVRFVPK